MSTRANIIIHDNHDKLIFYRHSDGYPEGALPTLKKFMRWVKQGKIRTNVEQASGWLVLLGAKEYNHKWENFGTDEAEKVELPDSEAFKPGEADEISGWKVGAYEPATEIHGDIEYKYWLDLKEPSITIEKINFDKKIDTITNFD